MLGPNQLGIYLESNQLDMRNIRFQLAGHIFRVQLAEHNGTLGPSELGISYSILISKDYWFIFLNDLLDPVVLVVLTRRQYCVTESY